MNQPRTLPLVLSGGYWFVTLHYHWIHSFSEEVDLLAWRSVASDCFVRKAALSITCPLLLVWSRHSHPHTRLWASYSVLLLVQEAHLHLNLFLILLSADLFQPCPVLRLQTFPVSCWRFRVLPSCPDLRLFLFRTAQNSFQGASKGSMAYQLQAGSRFRM